MGVWILRIISGIFILLALLVIAMGLFLFFGPISNPSVMVSQIFGSGIESPTRSIVEQRLEVPKGFSIGKYATGLSNVRMMEFTRAGDLVVSQPREGKVVLLKRDANRDGHHDGKVPLLDKLRRPHGLAFYKNFLYIAESNAVGRIPFDQENGMVTGNYETVISDLPDNGNHWTKSILIKDDMLYVSIGSSCNVCEESDNRRATIMRFDSDGGNGKIFASGLRNSVGLAVSPRTGEFFATDNGRDMLGDDYPPCELNKIEEDSFYGWPFINGFGDLDPDLGGGNEQLLNYARSPVFGFPPHSAPLGIRFLTGTKMPTGYERSAVVALHGSWNRREPDGYKIVSLHWHDQGDITSKDFLTGFERDGNVIGRPVDIAEGPDGCLYVSDDYSGTIYRICYNMAQNTDITPASTESVRDAYWQALSSGERQELVQQGEVLYQHNGCTECHLVETKNNDGVKVLQRLGERYTSESLANYFLTPNPPMPQYNLSKQERLALASYLLMETAGDQ